MRESSALSLEDEGVCAQPVQLCMVLVQSLPPFIPYCTPPQTTHLLVVQRGHLVLALRVAGVVVDGEPGEEEGGWQAGEQVR